MTSSFLHQRHFRRLEPARQVSRGRIKEVYEYQGQRINIIRSTQRKRYVQASFREGELQIMVPGSMALNEIFKHTEELMAKIQKKREGRPGASDEALMKRALHLAATWLGGEVRPAEVVWSSRQTSRWGSCTPATGRIRVSDALKPMPQWVTDGVLIHEMAHLRYDDHGDDFHNFANRYPRMAEAMAFLDGVSFANHQAGRQTPHTVNQEETDAGGALDS